VLKLRQRRYKNAVEQAAGILLTSCIVEGDQLVVLNCPYCGLDHAHSGHTSDTRRDRGRRVPHCSGSQDVREYRLWWSGRISTFATATVATSATPSPPNRRSSGHSQRPDWRKYVEGVEARLAAGERVYGGTSFERPTLELLTEIEEELLDVTGWGYVLWSRLQRMREAFNEMEQPGQDRGCHLSGSCTGETK
jgi:hypothetical protein